MSDVFISYSFSDQEDAEYIVNTLVEKYGISCWICTRDIAKGDNYKEKIAEAIESSGVVVLIQSKSAVESIEIPKEIGIALEEEKKIIPFRIDTAKLKNALRYDLNGVEYIDATIPTREQRIDDLAKTILRLKNDNNSRFYQKSSNYCMQSLKSTRISCSEIFDGRNQLIENIHEEFNKRNIIFLYGMGGIGKSELAKQYWRKYKEFYNTVVFARYENNISSLVADDEIFNICGMARKMVKDIKTKADTLQTNEEYAKEKIDFLNRHADERTLIILDNFNVSTGEISAFEDLWGNSKVRILVTTRCEPDRKRYFSLKVNEIEDNTLKKIFIEYANPQKTIIEEDDANFNELFELTDRHTYTLELIAKYMEENDDIDELYEMIELLKRQSISHIKATGYDNIQKMFKLTILDEKEKYFLRCLAMMPGSGIPQKLFKKWIGESFSARSRLADLSLVKINGEMRTISLHPVIKDLVIKELNPSYLNCKQFIDKCAMVGEDYIPKMWSLSYKDKNTMYECFKNILSFVTVIDSDTFELYANISQLFNYIGDYAETISLLEKIYNYSCERFGKYSERSMLMLNRIAWKNSNCQIYSKALPCYKTVADWFIDNPCYTSREAQSSIQGCGNAFYYMYKISNDLSDLKNAYNYYDKYVEYGKKMLETAKNKSEDSYFYLNYQNDCICRNYFRLYLEEGRYDEAEKCIKKYKNSIEEFQTHFGSRAADMADYCMLNAKLEMALHNFEKAFDLLDQAFRTYTEFFSEKNPRTIEILENITICCMETRKYEEAKFFVSKAMENSQKIYVDDHPVVLRLKELKSKLEI